MEAPDSFGRFQMRITAAIFYTNMIGVWQTYYVVFMTFSSPFRCVEPAPGPNGTNDTCQVNNGTHLRPCTKWEYDGPRTLISEWDLVCDREWLVSMAKSAYMIGFLFAVISFGQLSDLIGRYRAMCIGHGLSVLSMFATLLSSSYVMFLILYFLQAFGRQGLQICSFVLLTEAVEVRHRTIVGIAFQVSWTIGCCFLTGVAYILKDWFWLQLVISVSFSTATISIALVSESPRWIHAKENQDKKNEIETRCSETNPRSLHENLDDTKAKEEKETTNEKKSKTILDLFKTPELRKRILILYYLWLTSVFMYYAFLYNTSDLAGDRYLNFLLATCMDYPSFAFLYWTIERFGRRLSLAAYMAVGAASCIARIIAVQQGIVWLQTSLWMLGVACSTSSLGVLYLYTSELFPTVVRNVAIGSCSSTSRVGAILAPFVKEIGNASGAWVPPSLFGSMCFIGCFVALLLPETKDQSMKDTLQEVDFSQGSDEKGTMNRNGSKVLETSS